MNLNLSWVLSRLKIILIFEINCEISDDHSLSIRGIGGLGPAKKNPVKFFMPT
jgi:hypothetical protein